jgi:hypothetical protein
MTIPQTLRLSALAAGLLLATSSFAADSSLSSLVYAGGEAMSPEAEARMTAQISAPGGAVSRDEVRQQLLAARQAGTLVEAGEIADTAPVLQARVDYAARQTRQILAGYEAERERLAAIEAERARVAALEAEQARQATLAAAATPATQDLAAAVQPMAAAPAADSATSQPLEAPADKPTDVPAERPGDTPTMAPVEVPITRPSDLPAETIVDKE